MFVGNKCPNKYKLDVAFVRVRVALMWISFRFNNTVSIGLSTNHEKKKRLSKLIFLPSPQRIRKVREIHSVGSNIFVTMHFLYTLFTVILDTQNTFLQNYITFRSSQIRI